MNKNSQYGSRGSQRSPRLGSTIAMMGIAAGTLGGIAGCGHEDTDTETAGVESEPVATEDRAVVRVAGAGRHRAPGTRRLVRAPPVCARSWVGHYPVSLFDSAGLAEEADAVDFGGEIIDTPGDGIHTATDMGSGNFASLGWTGLLGLRGLPVRGLAGLL